MSFSTIAVIDGTGPLGKGLAFRFAAAGHRVVLASRDPGRAQAAATELSARLPGTADITGTVNAQAADSAAVVVLAVPYDGLAELVTELRQPLAGKIVVSCVNPLGFDKHGAYGLAVEHGSAAEQIAALLPESRVVGAFHHLPAVSLLRDGLVDQDVLVCGNDADARAVVMTLACAVTGRVGIDAGPLRMARQLEPFTAVLISINKRYKAHSGVRISGLPEGDQRDSSRGSADQTAHSS